MQNRFSIVSQMLPTLTCCALLVSILVVSTASSGTPEFQGSWQSLPPAPFQRTEVSATVLDSQIYVIGGFDKPHINNVHHYTVSNHVNVFDTTTNQWTEKASLPIHVHHAGIVTLDDSIYIIGGFSPSLFSVWNPLDSVFQYDPSSDSWSSRSPMPTPRGALAVTSAAGKIFALGGVSNGKNSAMVEVYDPQTDTWSYETSLPTPRDHFVAVTLEGEIYTIGGRLEGDYGRNLGTMEIYNPLEKTWRTGVPLPTPRSGHAAGALHSFIVTVGGESPSGTFHTHEVYLIEHKTWISAPPMPTARHGLGGAVVANQFYAISGGPTPGGSYSNKVERFILDISQPSPHTTGQAPSSQVGAVMAILATFEEAEVLPPEGTPEANRIIQSLIQLQSLFTKSRDPSVNHLLEMACRESFGESGGRVAETFKVNGWSSEVLEALVDYAGSHNVWTPALKEGFQPFNMRRKNFELIAELFRNARNGLSAKGKQIHDVYGEWRKRMPGATR